MSNFTEAKRDLKRILRNARRRNPNRTILLAKDGLSIGLFLWNPNTGYLIHAVLANGSRLDIDPNGHRAPQVNRADYLELKPVNAGANA